MPSPVIQAVTGPVNGVNREFETSVEYRPGSVRPFRNGLVERVDLVDGWVELGGKRFRMNEAPIAGDVMQAYYTPVM